MNGSDENWCKMCALVKFGGTSKIFGDIYFFGVPHLATYIFFLFVNEPGLGTLINLALL